MSIDEAARPTLQSLGARLYRDNAFAVSGLPVDASTARIRRRRDELLRRARLVDTPAQRRSGASGTDGVPIDVDAALSVLQRPVQRLQHEVFWFWCPSYGDGCSDSDHELHHAHDMVITRHRDLLEAELAGTPAPESAWEQALAAWAALLARSDLLQRLHERAREIHDPRLDTNAVQAVHDHIGEDVLVVNLTLAFSGNGDDYEALARHGQLLRTAPLPGLIGPRLVRSAVRPLETRVVTACETASDNARRSPATGRDEAIDLLKRTERDVAAAHALLGADDEVAGALGEQVADAANRACVAYIDNVDEPVAVSAVLRRALDLAYEQATRELIESNLRIADSSAVVLRVRALCDAGRLNTAYDSVWLWARRTQDEPTREQLRSVLAEPRTLRSRLQGNPAQFRINGVGTIAVGQRAANNENWIRTYYFCILWIPLVPISAHIVDNHYIYGRVPLSPAARWWRRILPVLLVGLFAHSLLVTSAVLGAAVLLQVVLWTFVWMRVSRWLRE